jgi:tartrate dehydratase alpha subunit/fumarate hydratase class I-like protein
VKAIDERTAPKKEIDHSAEAAAAAVAMGGGMMGLGGNLMIGDVGGYGKPASLSSFSSMTDPPL